MTIEEYIEKLEWMLISKEKEIAMLKDKLKRLEAAATKAVK